MPTACPMTVRDSSAVSSWLTVSVRLSTSSACESSMSAMSSSTMSSSISAFESSPAGLVSSGDDGVPDIEPALSLNPQHPQHRNVRRKAMGSPGATHRATDPANQGQPDRQGQTSMADGFEPLFLGCD